MVMNRESLPISPDEVNSEGKKAAIDQQVLVTMVGDVGDMRSCNDRELGLGPINNPIVVAIATDSRTCETG